MTTPSNRWLTTTLAVLATAALLAAPLGAPTAAAQPSGDATANEDGPPPLLGDVLEQAGRTYLDAKAKLDQSTKRQLVLNLDLRRAENRLAELTPQVEQIAAQSYRTGRIGPAAMLLNSASPDSFFDRAATLDELNIINGKRVAELAQVVNEAARAKEAIDAEVRDQRKQVAVMNAQKKEAERALALVGGRSLTGGFVSATSPVARPAPRTSSGGWPSESCSQDDPTTAGCLTPRTLHAYREVKRAGFNRFVGCHRSGGPFEHPKGRACDWSLRNSGFTPARNQDERTYGNNLTAFLVRNADRLGILYVIWNRQIWLPSNGWSSYSGASDHTDHVHMSML
ncbi:hypothetical protein O7627_05145 [Solwaraspora sp. WMMD1047]|uniref:coiled-coil domain-containing protein n=1 Tax=Solwaraspora sp. WMMD1047 TaxID=3016102 RepID=UPI002416E6C6|nr:hypothetical protein [Solwaraspora sp. WMMD1047]MDG4828692.1 hypothetical protein [Solwaraspora sp. WMMD1047]